MTTPARDIELFFDVGSPYTYLAYSQIEAIEKECGVPVRLRPFLLGGVFKATGNTPPAQVANKATWMLGDLARWARRYEIPYTFPSRFPLSTLPTQRALAGVELKGDHAALRRFGRALFEAYWVHDRDVTDRAVIAELATSVGLDGAEVTLSIDAPEAKDLLRKTTEEAVARGAFGSPTFFVGSDMFFGNDRIVLLESLFR